ncbi:MAG: hypothetical protein IJF27_06310 [Oscillospiraceae bacterium]|nr:hypothetical protein [Oscillospiraceae bacterium]MBQ3049313.1 hypothetical protein [Oscillospiraceae bacterium]MBQ9939024.1 hypothetical protein [Oscillospiraceae bacterium]
MKNLHSRNTEENNVLHEADDRDMKIVGAVKEKTPDAGEREAALYEKHRDNGNLKKASRLGNRLAAELLRKDSAAMIGRDEMESLLMLRNRRILFAFVADITLELQTPDSIIAECAQDAFYDYIKDNDSELYEYIENASEFSMYLACGRSKKSAAASIGKTFAKLVEMPGRRLIELFGSELYDYYFYFCSKLIKEAGFSK